MNRRIFVDMDGTLAKWNNVPPENLYEKGYYENLRPNQDLINQIKELINDGEDIYILSSFLYDSNYALSEKNIWLDKYLPEIPFEKRIFVRYGESKKDYIENGITLSDYLIDDYTKNLLEWRSAGGTGIKYLNGINHTRGTWDGFKIQDNNEKTESIKFILNYSNDKNYKYNERYISLRSNLLDAINEYRKCIDKSTKQLFSAGIQIKKIRNLFLKERMEILNLFQIKEKNRWLDDGNMIIHYQINFKNGHTLYEGYTYLDLSPEQITDERLVNYILNTDLSEKIDITKVSRKVKSFVDDILSIDHDGKVRLNESELMSSWDLDRDELACEMKEVEKELNNLGIRSTVDIFYNSDGYVSYIDVNPDIILEFDFSNERNKKMKSINEDLELEMEYE